jgi:flagellar biosynthesis/type III secretory pathway protein FliH
MTDSNYDKGWQAGFQAGKAEGLQQLADIIKQLDDFRVRAEHIDLELQELRRRLGMMPRIN